MDIELKGEFILLDVTAQDKFELLKKLSNNLYKLGYVKSSYENAVIEREKVFATGLPTLMGGVAIPHTDIEHVNMPAISIARLKEPVKFVIMGDDSNTVDVDLVFMLAMKEEHAQLELLQSLMGILQDENALKFVKTEQSKEAIRSFVNKKLQIEN